MVTVTPFSTALLAEYPAYRLALLIYWLNIFLLGTTLYWSWMCAVGSGLVKEDMPAHVSDAVTRRIVIAQSLYASGALLCLVNPYWSIGFIVLVQLNYVIAPRFGRRARE